MDEFTNLHNGNFCLFYYNKKAFKCKVITGRNISIISYLLNLLLWWDKFDQKSRKPGEQSRLKNMGRVSRSPDAILSPCHLLFIVYKDMCRSAGGTTRGVTQDVLSQGRNITTYIPGGWQTTLLTTWHPLESPSDTKVGYTIHKSRECGCPWVHDCWQVAGLRSERCLERGTTACPEGVVPSHKERESLPFSVSCSVSAKFNNRWPSLWFLIEFSAPGRARAVSWRLTRVRSLLPTWVEENTAKGKSLDTHVSFIFYSWFINSFITQLMMVNRSKASSTRGILF